MKNRFLKILSILLTLCCTFMLVACGESEVDPATCSHSFGEWKTITAAKSCAEPGEAARNCTICGFSESKELIIEHTEVVDKGVTPTCTKKGMSDGKHCSVCNTVLVKQEELPPAHNYVNGYKCNCGQYNEEGKIVVMSQNLRAADDGPGRSIKQRAVRFQQLVEKYQPDIIGTQEVNGTWKIELSFIFAKQYASIGTGLILYRRDRFELVDYGNFWLSDTPDVSSSFEGSLFARYCSWAVLKDKNTGKSFVIANTHLDHSTDEIREKQATVLIKELGDLIDKYPLFLTGDFNTLPDSPSYNVTVAKLADASKSALVNKSTIDYTFDDYGTLNPGRTIDYCFYTNKKIDAFWFKIANEKFDDFVSDHYAVVGEFLLK